MVSTELLYITLYIVPLRIPLTFVMAMSTRRGDNHPQQMMGTLKVPPAWSPEWEDEYPFRMWLRNVVLWSIATDVPPEAQGAAVVLRLGGTARELSSEMEPEVLQNGRLMDLEDGQGERPVTGLAVLLKGLTRQFGQLNVEKAIRAIAEMMYWSIMPRETVDETLCRYEFVRHRAETQGGLDLGPTGSSWRLLTGLYIPPAQWIQLLAPFGGNLPSTEEQHKELVGIIRRQGHLLSRGGVAQAADIAQQRRNHQGGYLFPTWNL